MSTNSLNSTLISSACPCGSKQALTVCCLPLLEGLATGPWAQTPEQLMRSRYSAYVLGYFDYVLATYTIETRPDISAATLAEDNQYTRWHALVVEKTTDTTVDFSAYYSEPGRLASSTRTLFRLAEHSRFIQSEGRWYYQDGDIKPDSGELKLGRNTACFCASGQKFKRCCAKLLTR